jgi:tRNA uridine 5-carboxymethylaminomethyl modification enzyme
MFVYPKRYDVIVVGGGHAGIEAALAAARIGCQTLLLTMNLDTIGQMSCNPAIGGIAKGHLAREVDALGGEMGKNTDLTGLQFRMLNLKKGPSVWAPRAQCDKKAYQFRLKRICEQQANLDCHQAQTVKIITSEGQACGVETSMGVQFQGTAIVITTGTFLRGLMHVGFQRQEGGRSGEAAATGLSASLKESGLELGRLKTGTPPRLNRRSIDFSKMEAQYGDEPVPYFTYWRDDLFHVEHSRLAGEPSGTRYPPGSILERLGGQLPCYLTATTNRTAEVIRANLDKSPLYAGMIEGVGPRYCPSIEDKIVRFADKDHHQIFLEPEGVATEEIYVNGCSTSLPFEVQVELVHSIQGCERAEILRPAYAIEYDYVFPTQLHPSLETKVCLNLFLAGQINGTSGYEEAAGQGIIAGINAARRTLGLDVIVLRRDQAYIGVLIDDLVTKGTTEPYRMFTSRAEYRLLLRQDNADQRLSEIGHQVGLLPQHCHLVFQKKLQDISSELDRVEKTRVGTTTLAQMLRRPEVSYRDLPSINPDLSEDVTCQVEIELKYAGYIERQGDDVARFRKMEAKMIPEGFDFSRIPGIKTEARLKLERIRPQTLGQAGRISGVSPADVSLLMVWLRRVQAQTDRQADPDATRVEG